MLIRPATPADVPEIARIYNHSILHETASFWTEPRPDAELLDQLNAAGPRYPWLVASEGTPSSASLLGVVWSKAWNPRDAYARTVEVSVYIAPEAKRRGVGTALYTDLFTKLRGLGYRTVIAGITVPNPASVRLHEKMGLTHVGTFTEIGHKFGRWLDVGYWQGRLEA